MHKEVHTEKIVSATIQLLGIVMAHFLFPQVLLNLQQQRRRTRTRVAGRRDFIQPHSCQPSYQCRCTRGGEVFSPFLPSVIGKESNEVHIGSTQNINLGLSDAEGNIVDTQHDLRNKLSAPRNLTAQVFILEVHVVKQLIEGSFRILAYGTAHQSVDSFLKVLDTELTCLDGVNESPPQIFRFHDISQVLQRPLLYGLCVIRVSKCLLVGNTIILQEVIHIVLSML